jgi:hypothetical protein
MRARFGDKVRLRVVGERTGWLRRRLGLWAPPPQWAHDLLAAAEARALWARFGL